VSDLKKLRIRDWAIVETQRLEDRVSACIYAKHLNCTHVHAEEEAFSDSWIMSDLMTRCYYCHTQVPDEIQALMILRTGSI
jgi:aspartate carbamoyltransferase regulatory subunit